MEFCARDAGEIAATEEALAGRGRTCRRRPARRRRRRRRWPRWVEAAAGRLGGIDVVVANVSALAIPDTEENW